MWSVIREKSDRPSIHRIRGFFLKICGSLLLDDLIPAGSIALVAQLGATKILEENALIANPTAHGEVAVAQ